MIISKRSLTLILTAVALCAASAASYADGALSRGVPDISKDGSISVTMRCGDEDVSGGALTLYRVGSIIETDGSYSFEATKDFAQCAETFTESDINSSGLAEELSEFASEKTLNGMVKAIDEIGNVSFDALEPGLYLLTQNTAAEGYKKASPFLVTVPMRVDKEGVGEYIYDVDASPKISLEREDIQNPIDPPDIKPKDPQLPQTGQLNWPVPVLTASGLILIICGLALSMGKKKRYEA